MIWSLIAMFSVAFGAATLLPLQSEILFVALLATMPDAVVPILIAASVGNTLGAVVNYALGRGIDTYRHHRWFPVKEETLNRARDWFRRWGIWALLVCWLPLGDALTLVAGVMRTPFWLFLAFVAFAKTSRYVVVAGLTMFVTG